jgi:hypothetical protein
VASGAPTTGGSPNRVSSRLPARLRGGWRRRPTPDLCASVLGPPARHRRPVRPPRSCGFGPLAQAEGLTGARQRSPVLERVRLSAGIPAERARL